jgi:hypothetical protein
MVAFSKINQGGNQQRLLLHESEHVCPSMSKEEDFAF